jgi:CRISPR associated protein Cas1
LITSQKNDFTFNERNRQPPLDNVNCLLSFIYTLLVHDVRAGLETVGLDPAQWALLKDRLISEIDSEKDSLRFYYLGSNWRHRVEHVGAKATLDQEGPLIV